MCVWHCVWEGRAGTWSLWDLLFPAFAGLLDPHKPRCWPKSKIWKLFCKPFWCPWPIACLLRSKRHCCLDEQRVCFRPETSESKSLIFIEHYLVIFPVIPDNSMYCVWCFFFWNEVCPVFKPNSYFWGLAHISGIWMGAVSRFTVF